LSTILVILLLILQCSVACYAARNITHPCLHNVSPSNVMYSAVLTELSLVSVYMQQCSHFSKSRWQTWRSKEK